MAQVQEYYDPSGLYPSPPQPRPRFVYGLDSSAPLCNHENLTPEVSMAQPLLHSPFRPENHMQQSQWPMPQAMSSSMMSAQNQLWGQLPLSCDMTWTGRPNETLMSETAHSMLANNDLLYSHNARQNTLTKSMDFGGPSFWNSNGMNIHRGDTVLSPDADILLSPVSPFSDAKHTYSPGPDCSPVTPNRGSASYKVLSSPDFVPHTPQPVVPLQTGSAAIQNGFGLTMIPACAFHMGNTVESADSGTQHDPERSYGHSQCSSPGDRSWYPPGYVSEETAMIQGSQRHQRATSPFDRRPNSFLASLDRNSRQRQAQWSNNSSVPAQNHFQTRFMTPVTADEKAQRTRDDEMLLQMKQDGYTYKDIRKALGRKVAESTLRGRYRSLTKPRNHRVRAPKWTEIDIMLLKRYVQEEFDKLDVTQPSLETKQKPDKIPWMKIVETIAMTGGTYKFGAATAKKKWVEVTRSAPFQLRYCPSLAKKPIPKLEKPTPTPKKPFDPFDNPSPDLHVIDIPTTSPTHLLVLNKFPIIASHFILATKTNKQQTHILEQNDLEATYACLKAWGEGAAEGSNQQRLFAFFNSGDHSGASQPHRHVQFLPVEHMRDSEAANGWDLLIDLILQGEKSTGTGRSPDSLQSPNILFAHFGRRFDSEPTGEQLVSIYNELYGLAKDAVDEFIAKNSSEFALHPTEGGDSPISYNLAMTTEGMVVLPRRSEGTMLKRPDGSEIGFVALNGTTLGGTMMVKHQEEWDVLRSQRGKLDSILNAIGIPRDVDTYKSRV